MWLTKRVDMISVPGCDCLKTSRKHTIALAAAARLELVTAL